MNTRKQWSNTHNSKNKSSFIYDGIFYSREEIVNEVQENFNIRRHNSTEGYEIECEGLKDWVLIQSYTNPMNEKKEDKKMHFPMNSNIKRGSYIKWLKYNETWITLSRIDIIGDAYKSIQIYKCNNTFKFKYNGLDINAPCILEEIGRNEMTLQEETRIQSSNSYYFLVMPNNNDTKKLPLGARFIFGLSVYKLIGIDDITEPGILKLKIQQDDERVGKDNFETGYADNSELKSNNYVLKIANDNISAKMGENSIQLNVQLLNNGVIQPSKLDDFIYQSDNTNICTIDSNGLVSFIGVGVCNISVQYKNDTTIKDSISVTVEQANIPVINKYTIAINGSNIIGKQTSSKINHPSEKYTAIINNNGVQDTSKTVKWELLNLDGVTPLTNGLVSMTILDGTHTQVFSTPTVGKFKLKASLSDDNSVFAIMKIEVTY